MKSKLLSKIRTVDEKNMLVGELDILSQSLYTDKGTGFESALKSKVRFWVSEIIKSEVKNDLQQIDSYLKTISEDMEKFEILTLKLAFEPSDAAIDRFFAFAKKESGSQLILDFEYDRSILGGAAVMFKGEYKDFSLKRVFEEEYKAKEEEIMKIMYSK